MHQLNLELLEQLDVTCGWMLDSNVIVPNKEKLTSLLRKARTLLEEIQTPTTLNQKSAIRRNFTTRKPDDNFTEPYYWFCKVLSTSTDF